MIESIELINFKPFENQFLKLCPLTLLTGINSTGKSSILQSLLLLRQSYQQGLLEKSQLALNGDLVGIGTAKDALFEGAQEDAIQFNIVWKWIDGKKTTKKWIFKYERELGILKPSQELFTKVAPPKKPDNSYNASLFTHKFDYLQAERIGPRTSYAMSDFPVRDMKSVGIRGEYTIYFLELNQNKPILHKKLSHPNVKTSQRTFDEPAIPSQALIDQVQAWMGEISPGTKLKINPNPDIDLISPQYFYGDNSPYRPTNVGFGISYTLPIIVTILASEPGTLILLENPEAHLHPQGQAKIGKLLALAASCGVQIIVETHSDHVLNGIRLAVHDGEIEPEDVQLHYFERKEKERIMVSEVISPIIDKNGRIDRWPPGFFDEWDKSLEALLEPTGE